MLLTFDSLQSAIMWSCSLRSFCSGYFTPSEGTLYVCSELWPKLFWPLFSWSFTLWGKLALAKNCEVVVFCFLMMLPAVASLGKFSARSRFYRSLGPWLRFSLIHVIVLCCAITHWTSTVVFYFVSCNHWTQAHPSCRESKAQSGQVWKQGVTVWKFADGPNSRQSDRWDEVIYSAVRGIKCSSGVGGEAGEAGVTSGNEASSWWG